MEPVAARHELDDPLATIHHLPVAEQVAVLMDDTQQQYPTRADLNRVERKSGRNRTVTIAVVALIAIAALVFGYFNSTAISQATTVGQLNTASIDALSKAREELKAQGVPEADLPVVPTVVSGPDVDVNSIVQAASALVLADIRTDPAFRGPTGLTGQAGLPCDPIAQPLCRGPAGERGIEGVQGGPGLNGITPVCVDTPTQCQGAAGDRGTDGANAPTPQSARFDLVEGQCVYTTVYSDGTEIRADAGFAACAP